MLTREENELLTRVGPDTPTGALFRRFWLPALFTEEIPVPDCPPVRVKLLGEELVAFRDSEGKIGIVDNYCPHRRASLYFGRNEECGIRCVYHGWKFDVDGNCMDMPTEPEDTPFKDKLKLTSYPTREHNGLIWIYMGPKDEEPAFPEYPWMKVDEEHRFMSKFRQQSNYMNALEGTLDSAHLNYLHRGSPYLAKRQRGGLLHVSIPKIVPVNTHYGVAVGAMRQREDKSSYCRISHFMLPSFSMVPEVDDDFGAGFAFVPIDDENTWVFTITWSKGRKLTVGEIDEYKNGMSIHADLIPGTYYPKANKDNDYLINRQMQASGVTFTGAIGVASEDQAAQESQGAIMDRTKEHLGTSDVGIISVRKRIIQAAQGLVNGEKPPGLDPVSHHAFPEGIVVKEDEKLEEILMNYSR